eukprot:TRINITY_DN1665_c0_g1_i1.p1 TRINITY_DN1665_c0_g1~~TRINITY_DN1665_c0_g1_i1.p1  ORF type:complete len:542 (-),score=240.46 TRINITY_DN1665_c0_g1_i1:12-1478(-)
MGDDGKAAKPKHYGVNPSLSGFGEFSIINTVAAIASQIRGGGDLTSITLPSCFCEPVTILEVLAYKRIRGMHYLTELKNLDHPLERALTILKWYLAPNTQDPYGKKPLNPILGETFRCQDQDKEWIYVSEQISHHPPISAFHFDHVSENIEVFGNAHVQAIMGAGYVAAGIKGPAVVRVDLAKNQKPKSKAGKKVKKHKKSSKAEGEGESSSAEPDVDSDTMTDPDSSLSQKKKKKSSKSSRKHEESPDATASSSSSDDVEDVSSEPKAPKKKKKKSSRSSEPAHDPIIEEYILDPSLPMGYARGLLAGSRFNELVGNVCIRCPQTKFEIHVEFTKAGWIWGEPHMVVGYIKHPDYSEKILKFQGKWTETIKVKKVHPDFKEIVDKFLPDGIAFDQEALDLIHYDDIHLIGSSTENKCSRAIWHDTNIGIRAGDLAVADTAKKIVEDRQRQYHKDMQNGVIEHKLRFFKPDDGLVKWIINRDADLDAE